MTLPDDSDFFEGTGNWAGINTALDPDTVIGTNVTVLEPRKVLLQAQQGLEAPPAGYGRGVMEVWTAEADETTDVLLDLRLGHRLRRVHRARTPTVRTTPTVPATSTPSRSASSLTRRVSTPSRPRSRWTCPSPVDVDAPVVRHRRRGDGLHLQVDLQRCRRPSRLAAWKGYQCHRHRPGRRRLRRARHLPRDQVGGSGRSPV